MIDVPFNRSTERILVSEVEAADFPLGKIRKSGNNQEGDRFGLKQQ